MKVVQKYQSKVSYKKFKFALDKVKCSIIMNRIVLFYLHL